MRPPSYRQRLFVEPYLGKSSGFAVAAARRAVHPWPEQMDRKMLRFVEKTRNSNRQNAPSEDRCAGNALKGIEARRPPLPGARWPSQRLPEAEGATQSLAAGKREAWGVIFLVFAFTGN